MSHRISPGCVCLVLTLACTTATAAAQDDERPKLAVQIMELMEWRKQVGSTFEALTKAQIEAATSMVRQSGRAADVERIGVMQRELNEVLVTELDWDGMSRETAQIYASVYSEEELRGILAFYQSPAGRAMVTKSPEVMNRMLGATQKLVAAVLPKIREIIKKYSPQ
jgi:hypothetical protein